MTRPRGRSGGIVAGMDTPDERRDRLQRLLATTKADLRRWTDASENDPGIALVELLGFLGDTLSAYADAIGDEAYLGSRRRRVTDLRVAIDGEGWRRVASLARSGPNDAHYVVKLAPHGATSIEFGDGVHGRRPPTDGEVRVTYRYGAGRYASVRFQPGRVELDPDWNEGGSSSVGDADETEG